jgi:hypothetical protein
MQRSWGLLWLLALVFSAGCYTRTPPERPVPVGLRPGDAVRVDIWEEEDLTGEFLVDANGKVVFPMLGERDVRGIAATEWEAQPTTEYREYLENPSVRVTTLRRIPTLSSAPFSGASPLRRFHGRPLQGLPRDRADGELLPEAPRLGFRGER